MSKSRKKAMILSKRLGAVTKMVPTKIKKNPAEIALKRPSLYLDEENLELSFNSFPPQLWYLNGISI